MRVYTVHLRPHSQPVLVAEGFAWGAFLFGGIWLLVQRAWIAGILALAAAVVIDALTDDPAAFVLELGLALLLGLIGRDLVRWSLFRRGYTTTQVLAAPDAESALARLVSNRPDLASLFMPPEAAR